MATTSTMALRLGALTLLDIADLGGAAIESSDTLTGVDPLVTVPLVP